MNTDPKHRADSLQPIAVREREAARLLGISPKSVFNLTKAGVLPSIKLGGCRLYSVAALQRWIDEQARQGAQPEGGQ